METIIALVIILGGAVAGYYALVQNKSVALGIFIMCHVLFVFVQLNLFPPACASLTVDGIKTYDLGGLISRFLNFGFSIIFMWIATGLLAGVYKLKNRFRH